MKFKSDIETQAGLIDSFGFSGSAGQILSSTGTKTEWITPPQSPGGGGSSQVFYFNGGTASSVGGYYQMSPVANTSTAADFTINANGYIASFLTDVNSPNQLNIPAGNWNFEIYFSASSGGGSPSFYVELYKYSSSTFTLIASSSASPEGITNGTAIDAYFTPLAVPATTLLATDRLAVRVYVTHSGRTITMHTQNGHLSEVITTFSTGLTALNGLTEQVQYFATGAGGTDFNIASAVNTHTFNLPTASATNRGALSSADWTTFNSKANASGTTNYVSKFTGATTLGNSIISEVSGVAISIAGNVSVNGNWATTYPIYQMIDTRVGGAEWNIENGRTIGNLEFYNGAAGGTKLTLTPSGNVGIGATSPVSIGTGITTLDIQGSAAGGIAFGLSGTKNYIYGASTMYVEAHTTAVFATSGSEKMRISSSGNVGIGTTVPQSKLEVRSSGAGNDGAVITLNRIGAWASAYSGLKLNTNDDGTDWWNVGMLATGNNTFNIGQNGGAMMSVLVSGNVGIGTTSPLARLSVRAIDNTSSNFSFEAANGSGNSLFYVRNDGLIGFANASTEVMRITPTGNVGIGTSAPANKLVATSDASPTSENTYAIAAAAASDPAYKTVIGYDFTNDIGLIAAVRTSIGWRNISMPQGSLGIGNIGPTEKLHVTGNIRVTGSYYDSSNSQGTSGQVLSSTGSGTDWVSLSEITGVDGTGTANYVSKWSDSNTITNSLIYDNGTNVGIGTTTPGAKLDLFGAIRFTRTDDTTQYSTIQSNSNGSFIATSYRPYAGAGYYGDYRFNAMDSTGATITPLYINTLGNVGIRTTNPISQLTVDNGNNGNITAGWMTTLGSTDQQSTANGFVGTNVYGGSGDSIYALRTGYQPQFIEFSWNDAMKFHTTTTPGSQGSAITGTEKMRITNAGNVGIGTSSPSYKLDVSGTGRFVNQLRVYSLLSDNQIKGSSYVELSPDQTTYNAWNIRVGAQAADNCYYITGGGVNILTTEGYSNPYTVKLYSNGAQTLTMTNSAIKFNAYGSGSFTGTATQKLAVDSSGNIIEIPIGAGPVDGSGTTNYVTKWTDADTIGNSIMFDNGTSVGIGTITPNGKFEIANAGDTSLFVTATSAGSATLNLYPTGGGISQVDAVGAVPLAFRTNSSEKMRITDAGNVGIGTSSPGAKLDVNGTGKFVDQLKVFNSAYPTTYATSLRTDSGAVGVLQLGNNNDNYILAGNTGANGYLIFRVNCSSESIASGIEAMRITSGGNVGIGTSSPSRLLNISGAGTDGTQLQINGTTDSAGIKLIPTSGDNWEIQANTSNQFFVYNRTDSAYRFLIDGSGNVGIGTTSPTQKLDVNGVAKANAFIFNAYSGSGNWQIGSDNSIDSGKGMYIYNSLGDYRISIKENGNVGIGTTAPNARLDVQQSVDGNAPVIFANSSTGTSARNAVTLGNNTGNIASIDLFGGNYNAGSADDVANGLRLFNLGAGGIAIRASNASGSIRSYIGSSEVMRVASNGNVGIGTSSPGAKLTVAEGDLKIEQTANTNATITLNPYTSALGTSYQWNLIGTNSSNSYGFQIREAGYTYLHINNSAGGNGGNVGIGTPSPGYKLSVNAASSADGIQVIQGGISRIVLTGEGVINWGSAANYGQLSWDTGKTILRATSGNALSLGSNAVDDRLYINTSGNVGIGTTSPTSPLHIVKSGGAKINLGDSQNTVAISSIEEVGDSAIGFYTQTTTERMRITSSGNVGIGTTSPGAKLDVNGDALINGLTVGRGAGNISTNTVIGNGALASTSSGGYNIAIGYIANSNSNVSGLTAIGAGLQYDTNLNNLEGDCLAISQTNGNADASQVPHIYAPKPISIGGGATNIITFDLLHYAGAIVEYMIRLDDGDDYALGTVYMGWKSLGSGNMIDVRQIEWSDMSGFVFSLGGSGQTLVLTNTSGNNAWIRITVRGMMTN